MPTKVDLPIGTPNSEALRVTYELAPAHCVMASWAHVEQQDSQYPGTSSATCTSASLYDHFTPDDAVTVDHTFIVGSITRHPAGATLTSFLDEAVWQRSWLPAIFCMMQLPMVPKTDADQRPTITSIPDNTSSN